MTSTPTTDRTAEALSNSLERIPHQYPTPFEVHALERISYFGAVRVNPFHQGEIGLLGNTSALFDPDIEWQSPSGASADLRVRVVHSEPLDSTSASSVDNVWSLPPVAEAIKLPWFAAPLKEVETLARIDIDPEFLNHKCHDIMAPVIRQVVKGLVDHSKSCSIKLVEVRFETDTYEESDKPIRVDVLRILIRGSSKDSVEMLMRLSYVEADVISKLTSSDQKVFREHFRIRVSGT